ncbi:hypothetical protein C3492_31215 [Streptomyces sp. Ru62]|uniref:DUF6881 domain-containing protein n=1 Tax=Streptomyces sp. Ru62 TaxID=2080745 RepID=UPI000CDDEE2C|nr:hypothetical protein [Streptomyces sp. Ru62]POX59752.1 hypothetical protein C3492_31215 [Streptomyces sp. Ru62]
MRYVRVAWSHDLEDEPVLYLSELGEDGYETRKIQYFRDGKVEWADELHETASVGLSEVAFPLDLREISDQPEFDAVEIAPEEFEREWIKARSAR